MTNESALSCGVNAKLADNVATKEAEPKIVMHDEVHRYVKGIYHVASVNASDSRCELDSILIPVLLDRILCVSQMRDIK